MRKKDEIQVKKQVVSSNGVKGEKRVLSLNDWVEVLLYLRTLSGTLHHFTGRDSIMHEGSRFQAKARRVCRAAEVLGHGWPWWMLEQG